MNDSPAAILFNTDGYAIGVNPRPVIVSPTEYGQTAFGETRVASPYTLTDLVNKYDISPLEYSSQTATGGTITHIPNQSAIALAVTGTSGSAVKLRTNAFYRYQAGKALTLKTTVYHSDSGQTNQVRRWGFFDDEDGLFYQLNGTALSIVRRTFTSGVAVDNVVSQASWNVDKLDGTGESDVLLDITKGNIYEIHLQWLGVGSVQFFINGILVHEMLNPNTLSAPYMRTAQLPLSWEVINTGASVGSTMTYICSSVVAEGGQEPPYYVFGAYNASDVITPVTERPLLSIRPKALFNSITNRMVLQPFLAIISCASGRAGYRIVANGSLTGAVWVSVDANSGAEFDVSSTALTGGQTILRGFLPNVNEVVEISLIELFTRNERGLRLNAFATSQNVVTIMGQNESAGTTNMRASITWKEIR